MRGLVVGLTGGIACGKSTVATFLQNHGALVISADAIGHRLLKQGSPIYESLIETFGENILDSDGHISRPKLGALVFEDEDARRQLNAMTHPVIVHQSLVEAYRYVIGAPATSVARTDIPVAVLDAPLLFEAGMQNFVDVIVVVTASETTQIQRLLERARSQGQSMNQQEAQARIASQMPLAEKAQCADFIIKNEDLNLQQLEKEVSSLWEELQRVRRRKKTLDGFGRSIVYLR